MFYLSDHFFPQYIFIENKVLWSDCCISGWFPSAFVQMNSVLYLAQILCPHAPCQFHVSEQWAAFEIYAEYVQLRG